MATVEVRFSPLPVHVRTARLIAATAARRAGVADDILSEVRLAVGEACSRAVGLHMDAGLDEPVVICLHIDEGRFGVEVADAVPLELHGITRESENSLGLALISGLVDDVEIRPATDGVVVRMSWPTTPA
ncbi:MAG TPA: ATP-binding protein [Sporichthyaceae bacterium]